ncbi:transposase [Streptomyces mirabilis]|uniref:transposase n=1 Tax=Streptomyces mirabilis TaxID=68239 RepID=UPI0037BDB735
MWGGNPERLGSEASFAALCGVSPVERSSGSRQYRRLNRGGDRNANRPLLWLRPVIAHPFGSRSGGSDLWSA